MGFTREYYRTKCYIAFSMTRFPILLSFLLSAFTAVAAPFPNPISGERPVSQPRFGFTPAAQNQPFVSSNGTLALAVWNDQRAGGDDLFATRIDAANRPLDPFGIALDRRAVAQGVFWNGTNFVVVARDGATNNFTLIFVSSEGTITGRRGPFAANALIAGSEEGPGLRLMLLRYSSPRRLVIIDGEGNIIKTEIEPPLPAGFNEQLFVLGSSGGSEFLILRFLQQQAAPASPYRILATRLALDGDILSSVDTGLQIEPSDTYALGAGRDGYLLATQHWVNPGVKVYRLDANGVFTGSSSVLMPPDPNDRHLFNLYRPRVVSEADGYLVAWHTSLQNGHSYLYAAKVRDDGTAAETRVIHDWVGISTGVALMSSGSQRLALISISRFGSATGTDVFSQSLSPSLDASSPAGLTFSAGSQSSLMTAGGSNGYAVGFEETGPDDVRRFFVQRMSSAGVPQDAEPIEVTALSPNDAVDLLTSSGPVYLAIWHSGGTILGRRLSASTGQWIDAGPFTIAAGTSVAAASNGTDVVVTWYDGVLNARRIPMSGPAFNEPVIRLHENGLADHIAVASNGSDYLVVWRKTAYNCMFHCFVSNDAILALRLRADATTIDAEPIVLDTEEQTRRQYPSVAWNRDRYGVAWGEGIDVHGAFITREGAILQDDVKLAREGQRPELVSYGDGFVMITRTNPPIRWDAVFFERDADLQTVIDLPRKTLLQSDVDRHSDLDVASSGNTLLVSYVRPAGPELGAVPRAFARVFANTTRRRVAR